jgi:cephalosporin-C deacetylase-like acetyl esterase
MSSYRNHLTAALALLLVVPALAQDASPFGDLDRYAFGYAYPGSQLKDHIYERSRRLFAAGDAQRDAIGTLDAVRQRQENIRRLVMAGIGGLPSGATPLNPRVTGTIEGNGFRIEKIIFESRPRHYVTANLYLPLNRPAGRTAAVLFLSGHFDAAKVAPEYQNVCQTLVRAGLIVLAQDPVGQGERLSYVESDTKNNPVGVGTRDHDYAGAQARFLGDALARYMLHDAMRGIDYLISRPEVDPAKIGVTGNSGGGTQTSLVMLMDPRVVAAAPATFIMNRDTYQRTGQPQDAEQIWPGFTGAGLDHEDILLAMAPKPVLGLAVTSDFFPIEGTRRTVTRSRRIWDLSGRGAALELVEDDSTHAYTPKLARAAAGFFAQHLLDRRVDLAGFEPKAFPPEQLHSTKSGQVRAEFADAEFVFDATAGRLKDVEAARAALTPADRQARAHDWLREQVLRQRDNTPLNPRRIDRGRAAGAFTVDIAFWYPQPYLANLGMLIRPRDRQTDRLPATIAIWDGGTAALSAHTEWITAECARGRAVFVVNLSGMGPLKPDAINQGPTDDLYGTWRKLADDLEWMGDSMVALRTYEALRSIEVLAEWPELDRDDVRFYGEGRIGVHAKLAAALALKVKGCEWRDGFTFADFVRTRSYDAKGIKPFILPGVLRYFDVDEL